MNLCFKTTSQTIIYYIVDWKCSKCLFSFLPLNVIEEENANCTDNPLLPVVNQINQNNIMTDTGSSYIKDSVNLKFDELNQKGLKLLHLNVRSLLRNISEIRLLLTQNDVHILSVNETWLDNSVLNNEIDIDDVQVIRKDRNRNGGGTAIYIKKGLHFEMLNHDSSNHLEALPILVSPNIHAKPLIFFIMV